ncbi:hypothetical protein GCM10011492_01510 [Flexivirga endophytica]|uniref:Uncharacterized protein n=1 Tax=Flexivirga endophytica TaxID=1849103 RepID=A0A916SSI0_9MICO|nr:hypothetical protein [Flexivirga endophytica]GGB15516.1 hypothetical protein GCM10011492_01510 [Flexivirga endophytica]GHB40056.1 hypothetical protein GCM10008112_06110 [Flexivirga endophytica]
MKLEDDGGCFSYADFGWPGLVGEFDGKVKYIAQDVLWKEKRPEGRVRRTGLGVGRRGWREAWHGEPLRQILYAAGVPPAGDPGWRRWDPARQPRRPRFTDWHS